MKTLKKYAKSIFAQTGEDGILDEIFTRLNIDKGFCVEFGASDGINISNTYHFIKNKGWGGLLIESDPVRFKALEENMNEFSNVELLQSLVSHEGDYSLDNIFKSRGMSDSGIDLISIDIDGSDYCVWEALSSCSPKCVVIEYAASFPPWVEYVEKPNRVLGFGSSALSLVKLGESKGYKLVALTGCNLIFVNDSLFKSLDIDEVNLNDVFEYERLSFILSKNTGEIFLSRKRPLHYMFPNELRDSFMPPDSESGFWPVYLIRR
tara:strand:+ start:112 stop:903 length:792 start_codon:yes stop_codon:yes gene_type:complete